ncbi:MAG TPA: methyltransferase domain-containing protein [Solirubrobacteraceae bacterium]|nr:methyltransferase domain-containing protein [Solirubrobacteraceae bacterium]
MGYARPMLDRLLRLFGWRLLLITGDPCVLDRWRWLRGHLLGGKLRTFDAGCGNGGFSIYAARQGNEVVAASFQSNEQESAERRAEILGVSGIDFRVIDLRELERHREELGTFDQIMCLETIEHVRDDEGLVKRLTTLLRPGGRMLLSTPYDAHRPLYTEDPAPAEVEDGSHVRFGYSRERLREIAAAAGLEVDSESFVSGLVSQKLTDLMRRLSERLGLMPAWLIVLPLRMLAPLDAPLSAMLRYPYLSVALCAVKPSAASST